MAHANSKLTPSGIRSVSELTWGSHFCQFYQAADDLRTLLVPYFKAGIDHNERCLWVTSEPLREDDARAALRAAVPDLEDRERGGQIEIIDHRRWYERGGALKPEEIIRGWHAKEERALADGYRGLRVNGNVRWLDHAHWPAFLDYEARANESFRGRQIVALCSYSLDRCTAGGVIDVMRNHEFALARQADGWDVVHKIRLDQVARDLERRMQTRMAELERAVTRLADSEARQRALRDELDHRVKNVLATVLSIARQTRREPGQDQETFYEDFIARLQALARIHEALTCARGNGARLSELVYQTLAPYADKEATRISVKGAEVQLSPNAAIAFQMVFHELATNAAKYGALSVPSGCVSVAWRKQGAETLEIDWIETSGPLVKAPLRRGFGSKLIERSLAYALGAAVKLSFAPTGCRCHISVPLTENVRLL